MVKVQCPVTINLEPTSSSIVLGCPGVPRSVPRIETKILLRSIDGLPFSLRSVGIELRTVQKLSVPSTIGSSESEHEYRLFEDPFLYVPPVGTYSSDNLIGVDLPVLLPLPRDIISSSYNANWDASTVHYLHVKVSTGDSVDSELSFMEKFPIPVKLYDSLPIYRQFTESVNESVISNDQQLIVEYNLKETCMGPNDTLRFFAKIMKNSLNYNVSNRLKLKSVNFQVIEILECHEGGLPPYKEVKLLDEYKDCKDANLNNEIPLNYTLNMPFNSDFLAIFEKKEMELQKYKYFDEKPHHVPYEINNHMNHRQNQIKLVDGVPMTHYQNFTSVGKLFSLRYEINLKLKLVHGKDFTVRIPIVLSPFNKISSEYLLSWIINQCKVSSTIFGKAAINQLAQTYNVREANNVLQTFKQPPKVYKFNRADWVKLGLSIDSFGTPQPIGTYID